MKYKTVFKYLGLQVSNSPCAYIMLGFTVALMCSIGMINLKLSSDPESLWVNPNKEAFQQQQTFVKYYGQYFRVNSAYLRPAVAGDDVFTKDYLMYMYAVETAIESKKVTFEGKEYGINDICYKPIPENGCIVTSPLEIWKMNYEALKKDNDVKKTATCVNSVFNDSLPCMSRGGYPIEQNEVLGGIECVGNVTSECTACEPEAKVLMITYLFQNDNFTQNIAEAWEKEVFEGVIDSVNDGTFNATQYVTKDDIKGVKPIYMSYMAQRSISDELVAQTKQNSVVIIVSYLLMFFYIAFAIGSFPNKVHSSFLLGLGGIVIVIISVLSSFGILAYFGIQASMISAEVIPFLILAIGVDNMFIIANAYHRIKTENKSIQQTIGETMAQVGPSITAAAACEFLAFFVGTTTGIPSLESFCMTASIAVLFDYLFQIFMFVGFLALDEKRKEQNRLDVFFCIPASEPQQPRGPWIKEQMEKRYIPLLFSKPCYAISAVLFFGLFGMSLYGYTQLSLGLEQQISVPEDSPVYNFFVDEANYAEIGPEAFLVFENVDWTNENSTKNVANLVTDLSRLECCVTSVYPWYSQFQASLDTETVPSRAIACGAFERAVMPFNQQLKDFLQIKIDSSCCTSFGICGEQYLQDMIFNDDGDLVASRYRFMHTALNTQDQFINGYLQPVTVANEYSKNFTDGGSAFAYSLFYVYFEQYTYIKGVALTNILLAVGIVYSAILLLKNYQAGLFVYFCVFFTTFDILGMMWAWNAIAGGYIVQINGVSVVNLITAVGLSVEFSVHIMLKFAGTKGSRLERAKIAVSEMGSSVLVGITTTKFLGVSVLAFAPSPIFTLYYFRMYMAIIVLGSFHGLVILPLVLSLIGPKHANEKKNLSLTSFTKEE